MSSDKPTCFIIHEFKSPYNERYEDIIEPALKSLNVKPLRGDEILGLNPVIEKIENAIREADLCIAEVSPNNPNVWLELGYALALKKPTIIICEKAKREKLPFDVQHRPVIFYSSESKSTYHELEERLKEYISNELKPALKKSPPSESKSNLDLLKQQLKVMCWESGRWNIYPIEKFTVKIEGEYLIITNSTFIHRFARLIFDKKLAGDLNASISLECNYRSIGLFTTDGKDRAIYIRPSDHQIDVKDRCDFKISRKNSNIKFQTGEGKRLYCNKYHAQEDMEFYSGISIRNESTVKIYSWEVEGA